LKLAVERVICFPDRNILDRGIIARSSVIPHERRTKNQNGASGGSMKKTFALCALVSSMMLTNVFATTNSDFHQGTVVSVEQAASPAAGASSDAPLRDASYPYDIAIRVGDIVYQTTYQSAFEDVSPVFATDQDVQASQKGNVLYVTLPGNLTVPMAIESRTAVNGAAANNFTN